jgi:hypothetical protein
MGLSRDGLYRRVCVRCGTCVLVTGAKERIHVVAHLIWLQLFISSEVAQPGQVFDSHV